MERVQRNSRSTPDAGPGPWFAQRRSAIDAELSDHLNALKSRVDPNCDLLDCVQYALLSGGKRLRPMLVLEACRACGGDESRAMPAALAVECVHAFSLVHDDLPAMDDDDLRRGRPTCHKAFGEAQAILAGDWLIAHAFELLGGASDADTKSEMVAALATGTASMVIGQSADIAGERKPPDAERVRFIHAHKTASLFETACTLGALAAEAPGAARQSLREYGRRCGLAFQIADDILDRTAATDDMGKRTAKDDVASKQTFPAVFGLEASRAHARDEVHAALASLDAFDQRADRLRALARIILTRVH